jgi:hypothetical protein
VAFGDHYLNTPEGLLAQHRTRHRRRFHFTMRGIEPRGKDSMPDDAKDEMQRRLLAQMVRLRRKAFRRPIALRLTLATTDQRTPTHSHHIAKNLLDLFGVIRPSVATGRKYLLYEDDDLVDALSVTCHHGQDAAMITGVATPLQPLLIDLDLALHSDLERRDDDRRGDAWELDRATEDLTSLLRNKDQYTSQFSERAYQSLVWSARHRAQELLLGQAAIRLSDLALMYDVAGRGAGIDLAAAWEKMFSTTPLRIRLSELPQVSGASDQWKKEIDEKLRAFRSRYDWLIDPLVVPVALEVVIKPPPPSRTNGLHDLDNVLRRYLIPRVTEILKPISHYAFALDTIRKSGDAGSKAHGAGLKGPPPSTKLGVSRYEVWRLPPAKEDSSGFVSVAIVADSSGYGDVFGQIDDEIERWRDSLD